MRRHSEAGKGSQGEQISCVVRFGRPRLRQNTSAAPRLQHRGRGYSTSHTSFEQANSRGEDEAQDDGHIAQFPVVCQEMCQESRR